MLTYKIMGSLNRLGLYLNMKYLKVVQMSNEAICMISRKSPKTMNGMPILCNPKCHFPNVLLPAAGNKQYRIPAIPLNLDRLLIVPVMNDKFQQIAVGVRWNRLKKIAANAHIQIL